ncbi:MAG: hypothetical protein AAF085_14725 [Planctomycetota bacterium]
MSNQERLMKQGLLAEKRAELKTLEDRAENALNALRAATFVYDSPLDLDGGNVVTAATDLDAIIKQASSVRKQITKLEDELGV